MSSRICFADVSGTIPRNSSDPWVGLRYSAGCSIAMQGYCKRWDISKSEKKYTTSVCKSMYICFGTERLFIKMQLAIFISAPHIIPDMFWNLQPCPVARLLLAIYHELWSWVLSVVLFRSHFSPRPLLDRNDYNPKMKPLGGCSSNPVS